MSLSIRGHGSTETEWELLKQDSPTGHLSDKRVRDRETWDSIFWELCT